MIGRAITACAVAGGLLLALAGSAAAEPGDLTYQSCLANENVQGCTDLPFAPINFASSVATSPDGKSVYVASEAGDSVAHFFRDTATGALAYDGCLNNDGSEGCGDLPHAPLDGASAVAVSPDGKSVYVTAWSSSSVAHFFRAPAGQIAYDGCLDNAGLNGCADMSGKPFNGPRGVTVSPDGKSVYVTSYANGSVTHLTRSSPGGQIAFDMCLDNAGSESCLDVPGTPLTGARSVAVSPDGRSVYVASGSPGSVSHMFRSRETGDIAWDGCLNGDGSSNCGDLPGEPLKGASSVAVSPDDKSVYVTSSAVDSVAHFFRSGPEGQITYDGCLNHDGTQSCVDLPGAPFDVPWGVATSPDGLSVYTASEVSSSVAHLLRSGPDGQIAFDGCLANNTSGGCGDIPFSPIAGARDVAVSPDGRSVYVVGSHTDSIAHFSREPVPAPPEPPVEEPSGPAGPGTGSGADTTVPAISRLRVTKPRTTFSYLLSEAATVRVTVQRARPGRRAARRYVALRPALVRAARAGRNTLRIRGRIGRSRLRPGSYRAVFSAIDASGNRSAPAAVNFRVTTQTTRRTK